MTHVVEHKSFRYTWELVRHTYIVDLESEIDIQQVAISPSFESRLLDPPYPRTSFFEIEIDQIQKNGKTVSSFRNICPVEISRKHGWNPVKSLLRSGSPRVTRRFQSQEGETETRWLYTDDLFLISLSSGDRHDLSMLLSLIIGKLNMIALSIQSGRRIRSEFENQQKYREAMSDMFSEGVDGAFRDVPVYKQHGDMTGSDIDVSAALMSVEMQDLMAECASGKPDGTENVPAEIPGDAPPDEEAPAECAAEKLGSTESVPGGIPGDAPPSEVAMAEHADTGPVPAGKIGEVRDPFANIMIKSTFAEVVFGERAARAESTVNESASVTDTAVERIQEESIPEENVPIKDIPVTLSCSSCGAGISGRKKFCGSCGAAVSPASATDSAPVTSRVTTPGSNDTSHSGPRPAAEPVVNLKSIEELDDLSWLTD